MTDQGFTVQGEVPDGWVSVDPRVVNEDGASVVLLRRADLNKPFTTNITVSQQVVRDADLPRFAAAYRRRLAGKAKNVAVVSDVTISEEPPRQHAQELRFTLTISGVDVEVVQAQLLTEVPTESGEDYLMQLLFSARADLYPVVKGEMAKFVESMTAVPNPSSNR